MNPQIAQQLGVLVSVLPPPSGGITALGIVQTIERFAPWSMSPWGAQYFHVLGETAKVCWQERYRHLADPDFVSIPAEELLSDRRADKRADQIRMGGILSKPQIADQSQHTSNVIAADGEGNLISFQERCTTSRLF